MKNKKGAIEFSTTTIIIIIIGIILLAMSLAWFEKSSFREQKYCERNPQDCEWDCKNFESDYFDNIKKVKNYLEYNNYMVRNCKYIFENISCEICKNPKKKNSCQLRLKDYELIEISKEDLEIKFPECICEEEIEWCEVDINRNEAIVWRCDLEPSINTKNKIIWKYKECIKSREANECEKNNPKYIEECKEYSTIFYGNGTEVTTTNCLGKICRKKELKDLTCEELDKLMGKGIYGAGSDVCLIEEKVGSFITTRILCFDKFQVWKKWFMDSCSIEGLKPIMDNYCETKEDL